MKYFKNIKYLILAVTGTFLLSCDTDEFLNPLPDTAVSAEGFFNNDQDVSAGIVGIYDAIQGVNENTESSNSGFNRGVQFEYLLTEHRSDNTRSKTLEGSRADFHRHIVTTDNIQSEDYYQSMYEIIFRANTILTYIDKADAANVAKYSAEVKFLRGYAYLNLVRLYGDVPLITRIVSQEEHELLFTRVAVATVYEQIISDFNEAIAQLDNSSRSKASKAAAQGLLAKVYLRRQASGDFALAKSLCEAIINSGDYSLESNFKDVFYNELNKEVIFAVEYMFGDPAESQGFTSEFTSTIRQGRQDGLNIVNANLVSDFTLNGGNRTAVSFITFGTDPEAVSEVAKFLPEGHEINLDAGTNIVDGTPNYGTNSGSAGNDWIILRYADVLLMHAEATMAGSGNTSDATSLNLFNAVRNRAGLGDDADGVISKDELLLERRVELAFENQRFYDLVRFGVANDVLDNNAIAQDDDADGTINGYTGYSVLKLLLPIPSREINLSSSTPTKMNQNEGYN